MPLNISRVNRAMLNEIAKSAYGVKNGYGKGGGLGDGRRRKSGGERGRIAEKPCTTYGRE